MKKKGIQRGEKRQTLETFRNYKQKLGEIQVSKGRGGTRKVFLSKVLRMPLTGKKGADVGIVGGPWQGGAGRPGWLWGSRAGHMSKTWLTERQRTGRKADRKQTPVRKGKTAIRQAP